MKTLRVDAGEVVLVLTPDELAALNNALNYVTNGVELGADYSSVIGVEPKEARRLLKALRAALGRG